MSDFESSQRISAPMWVLAALGAAAIHLACIAAALAYLQDDDPDPELGAPAIEIGVELLAPRAEPTDLPVGLDADESAASTPVVEQTKIPEPTELPREVPTESQNPDLVVSPTDRQKPKDDEPPTPTVPTNSSAATVATQAAAVPTTEVIEGFQSSVTPAQGSSESPQRVRAIWQKELIAHFDRHKRYPAVHSLDNAEILVKFVLDETGRVLSSSIVQGSGDATLDEAALAMIRRSDPVPSPPPLVVQQGLSFTLPVIFRVKHLN